jgi:hypothetical protein
MRGRVHSCGLARCECWASVWTGSGVRTELDSKLSVTAKHANPVWVCSHSRSLSASAHLAPEATCDAVRVYISLSVPVYALTMSYSCVGLNAALPDFTPRYGHLAHQFSDLFKVSCVAHMQNCARHKKRWNIPVTGLEWPRGFQEVKVPRFHDKGTGWW